MPGIHLYSSNRLEALSDVFADVVHSDPLPPFHKETILIQSRGMARWLAMETAARLNIWANCDCPFPNTFIRRIYKLLLPDISVLSSYDKDFITWHLMDILPELSKNPYFQKVLVYLDKNDDLKLYQLASEISDLFDQYTLYRPQMILDWENRSKKIPDEHAWQSILWCTLVERFNKDPHIMGFHRARLLQLFQEKILDPAFDARILPARISVFGITSLPPYHFKVLESLARHIDLHLFIMNPCMEYWFDIIADRDIVKISRMEKSSQETLHLKQGNSLLSSMGHLGRDFMLMLQDIYTDDNEFFKDPGSEYLLANIQQDILYLRENTDLSSSTPFEKTEITVSDNSISFHSCHSPMREVEILYDQLLDLFNNTDNEDQIEPRDILVMAPEIDEYAPLVRAVFDAASTQSKKIPYSISDQSLRKSNKYIKTFFEILALSNSRFTSVDVLEILQNESVKKRFSMNDKNLATIETWIQETNICWGIDRDHKSKLQLPAYAENTWRAGLDRLLLGFSMQGNNQTLFENILPYDDLEGNDTKLLGNFLDFAENLFSLLETFQKLHTLAEWSDILLQIKEKFLFTDAESELEDRILHQLLYGLRDLQIQTAFTQKVSIEVICSFLLNGIEQRFSTIAGEAGFLTGGVTFCSMLPMRAIPFKIVCLLGMNDGQYPRSGHKRSFDLMSFSPKRGDRSRRYDDRYLFLETILSARNRLIISFVGQSIQNGNPKPPSVLVNELMDFIDQGYKLTDEKNIPTPQIIDQLTTMHHLQPFHPDYFRQQPQGFHEKLFSYSQENCAAAFALISQQQKSKPVISSPLPVPPDEYKNLDFNELIKFFSHPTKYLLVKMFGMAPIEDNRLLNTSEPFLITGLDRYKFENNILEQLIAGRDCDELFEINKAAGKLPHGQMGKIHFAHLVSEVQTFKKILDELLSGKKRQQQDVNFKLDDFTITGRLLNLYETGLVLSRYATIKPKDMIRSWISHLVLNTVQNKGITLPETTTFLVGKKNIIKYSPLPESGHHLEQLLALHWQGLSEPLCFFPQTSFAYAREIHKGKNVQEALLKASIEWEGNNYNKSGEKNDPYIRLCFKDTILSEPLFADTAIKIFLPILELQEKYN